MTEIDLWKARAEVREVIVKALGK